MFGETIVSNVKTLQMCVHRVRKLTEEGKDIQAYGEVMSLSEGLRLIERDMKREIEERVNNAKG